MSIAGFHSLVLRARRAVNVLVAAFALGAAASASAAPVLGAQLYWQGGDVTVEVQRATAAYNSELRLYHPDSTYTFIAYNAPNRNPVGTTMALGAAWLDGFYNVGDELLFGIHVLNTGHTFWMGPALRNADRQFHATVNATARPGWYRVSFEDLYGGGDRDYDDNVFDFRGSIRPQGQVSEPAVLGLALWGLAGAVALRRRRPSAV
ncbi:MAG: hypothetical protein ACK520_16295 [Inhella sp.]|jgi:hypothetical protein|uniref:hypothetical protein n=1 Tax=Inhella sp. TaxID=1921806 RepID=UPI0022CBF3F3|nr:hypothetical protein [Inhella sp.]MCZ8235632.1 hypothetical protein [Inhella sp.]